MVLFTRAGAGGGAVHDMVLEAVFDDGRVVQAMRTRPPIEVLMYRESRDGRWLHAEGVSFGGLPRTLENLVRSVGGADPATEVYVLPAT